MGLRGFLGLLVCAHATAQQPPAHLQCATDDRVLNQLSAMAQQQPARPHERGLRVGAKFGNDSIPGSNNDGETGSGGFKIAFYWETPKGRRKSVEVQADTVMYTWRKEPNKNSEAYKNRVAATGKYVDYDYGSRESLICRFRSLDPKTGRYYSITGGLNHDTSSERALVVKAHKALQGERRVGYGYKNNSVDVNRYEVFGVYGIGVEKFFGSHFFYDLHGAARLSTDLDRMALEGGAAIGVSTEKAEEGNRPWFAPSFRASVGIQCQQWSGGERDISGILDLATSIRVSRATFIDLIGRVRQPIEQSDEMSFGGLNDSEPYFELGIYCTTKF